MFKLGDKVRCLKSDRIGEVVAIEPDGWIRPLKVQWAKFEFQHFTIDGRGNTLSKDVLISLES